MSISVAMVRSISVEIAKATSSKTPTTVERLRRLKERGLIERDAANAWSASA